jgi:SagB-type dehydrogenase family enzyme
VFSPPPPPPPADPFHQWADWNPAAGYFHFSTKDAHGPMVPAVTMRRLRRRARLHPLPPATKRYPGRAHLALPPPDTTGEFARTLLERRTWRTFSRRPIDMAQVATLLGLTFGVQQWKDVRGIGRLAAKTSPSGGSRHPIEAYVLALRVTGLPRGIYHYDAGHHRLERLSGQASASQFVEYLNGQTWFGGAALGIIMTAVFARTQWKYRAPRAYRAVLIEAGHVCQTFCLLATSLGLAPFCTMALADTRVERGLGIDGVSESALYAAGVGARPSGMTTPPWGVPLHPPSHARRDR